MQALVITLDGPAGSGKSTIARRLAQRLGLEFLDTGAMYRAISAQCLDTGIDPARDAAGTADLARRSRLWFDWKTDPPRMFIHTTPAAGNRSPYLGVDRDVTGRLRDTDVTSRVSDVAAMSPVRAVLQDAQRRIGAEHPQLVTEGRDQGSAVFPNAQVKFYLDATPQIRARRRAEQLRQAGNSADEQEILPQIVARDHKDSTRKDTPLVRPQGAVNVDTSELTIEQVLDLLEQLVRERAKLPAAPVRETEAR